MAQVRGKSMPVNEHRCALEFYDESGKRLGQQAVEVDLEPARECARLELLRSRQAAPGGPGSPGRMVPRWSTKLGAPYIEGFGIEFDGGEPPGVDFPNTYFRSTAARAAERYISEGSLGEQDSFHYLVMAFPVDVDEARPPFLVHRLPVPLPIVESSLGPLRAGAWLAGDHDPRDLPVFLPEALLREVRELSRDSGGSECGGVLLGHLHRDRNAPELFVEVTVQVPARHVEASADRLTFTPETWRDVDAARALRAVGEIMLGWWHSHPVGTWCRDCAPEKRRECSLAEGFLSTHDRHLQRTVFPGAHCVALVVTDPGDREPTCALFGWRRGLLARRGYFIRPDGKPAQRSRERTGPSQRRKPEEVQHGSACPAECRSPARSGCCRAQRGPAPGPRDDPEPPRAGDGTRRATALPAGHVREP
jgi:proteasome lid subunit RPN8/RPN11